MTHWAHGGGTSVTNSALLCWFHHQLVDARGITMHWTGRPTTHADTDSTPDGAPAALLETGWAFTGARGHRIRLSDALEPLPDAAGSAHPAAEPPAAEAA